MISPLVSVITSVYNCEKFIKLSLLSIFNQTFKNFEFIIINDGSIDKTADLIQGLLESFSGTLIFISKSTNKGIATRRTEAIRKSQGKYIAIHDGDDISLPERLEKQVEYLEENEDIFCVGSKAIRIDENNKEIGEISYPPEENKDIIEKIKEIGCNPIIDPSSMFRKSDFLELGGYSLDKSINLVLDFYLWTRAILNNKKFHNLPEFLIKYRINTNGNTLKYKEEMIKQYLKVYKGYLLKKHNSK